MHQAQWSPERPLPPPVSLTSQSHHEKPPEVTCTSRGTPGLDEKDKGKRKIKDGPILFWANVGMVDSLLATSFS